MRAQVVVLGPVEREVFVRLSDDLLPAGTKRADEISRRIVGCGVEVSERLSRLGLSAAIVTGIGSTAEDKAVLSALRKRGVQTRGARSGGRPTSETVRVRTPRHEVRLAAPDLGGTPSKQVVLRALPGSRHFHVCGSSLVERRSIDTASAALARAASLGAGTSLDVRHGPPARRWHGLRRLLRHVDILFADSESLRALVEHARVGAAASAALALGASASAVALGSGGWRVYWRDANERTVRVPRLAAEVERPQNAFASGFLLGSLLGSRPDVCAVLGAAAAIDSHKHRLPDRRELASRIADARKNPALGKLVPVLADAIRILERTRRLPRRSLARSVHP